jgi:hypothetical protein
MSGGRVLLPDARLQIESRLKPWQGWPVVGLKQDAPCVIGEAPTGMNNLEIKGDWNIGIGQASQMSREA